MMRDREEPASECAAPSIEARQRGQRLGEDLAGGIFRRFPILQPPEAMRVNSIDMAKIERPEGLRIGTRALDQLEISELPFHGSFLDTGLAQRQTGQHRELRS